MFYFDIIKEFYKNKIEYLIVGGLAVNLHGVPRTTQDLDIIIALNKENILKINKILKKLGYIPRLPVNPDSLADEKTRNSWAKEKNLKAFSFYHAVDNYKVIDVVLFSPIEFAASFKNKIIKKAQDVELNLINVDDLIKMKKFSGRAHDLSDVKLLEELKKWQKKL